MREKERMIYLRPECFLFFVMLCYVLNRLHHQKTAFSFKLYYIEEKGIEKENVIEI